MTPDRADGASAQELDKLQEVLEKLQLSSGSDRRSATEATLMRCTRDLIVKGTTCCQAGSAEECLARAQVAASSNIRVAKWVSTLESIRRDQRKSDSSDTVSNFPSSGSSGDEALTVGTSATSAQRTVLGCEGVDEVGEDSDDDLETDLAKAALDTGTKAFELQDWAEADSFLQEALRVLQQLAKQKRAFCDIFDLQYKLTVCAYHIQEPADAEEALLSLIHQSASSDEERGYICDAVQLLSYLCLRMGQIDRARSECEKVLQARRRLLGKRSDASLESTALMAHISALLNNRARAQSYLAMIPEARRDAVLKAVETSLGTEVEHPHAPSPLARLISGDSETAAKRAQSRLSPSSLALPVQNHCHGSESTTTPQLSAVNFNLLYQRLPSNRVELEDLRSVTVASLSSSGEERSISRAADKYGANEGLCLDPGTCDTGSLSSSEPLAVDTNFKGKMLSRKEILEKMGCQPKDRIEEAVCDGDYSAFASLLARRKDFWRSKLRKHVRPERVTALHFAALFGEIDMAQRLLGSSFKINEVPFGYTTSLTPLKFAIGARRVDMVDFLISNGARPSGLDSWSTLAAQLLNRSWLVKTMSEAEREETPSQIIAISSILLRHGWDVNAPFEPSGETVLHQAVAFWSGSYRWDIHLRAAMTSFLCESGADPFQANRDGRTPYDMALASGHQDLLLVLHRHTSMEGVDDGRPADPVELSSDSLGTVQQPIFNHDSSYS